MTRKEIGVLFSRGNLFDFMDVNENRNFDLKDTPLNLVSLSNDQPVDFLSGGEELLLAMENEFAKNKKIYLLDEVTSALDEQNLSAVMDILIKQSKNSLILMATHDRRIMNYAKNISISSITNFHQTSEE